MNGEQIWKMECDVDNDGEIIGSFISEMVWGHCCLKHINIYILYMKIPQ